MFEYRVYQLKKSELRSKGFRWYSEVKAEFGEPRKEWYDEVYRFESEVELRPDDLFEMFNLDRPDDFKGHSLSVGDVVYMPDGYWYCDAFGWVELGWR